MSNIHVFVYTITMYDFVLVFLMQCCKQLMVSTGPNKLVCFILSYLFSVASYMSVK